MREESGGMETDEQGGTVAAEDERVVRVRG